MVPPPQTSPPPGMPGPGRPYSPDRLNAAIYVRRYLNLILRRWPILAASVVLALSFSIYRAVTTPDQFMAYSVLNVAPRVQTTDTSRVQYQEAAENYYSDQLVRMNSLVVRDRAAAVVATNLAIALPKDLTTRAVRETGSFFRLTVQSSDFEYARQFSIAWASEFIASSRQVKNQTLKAKEVTTRSQVISTSERLKEIQEKLLAFLQTNNIASIKDLTEGAQQRLQGLENEYNTIKIRRQRLEQLTREDLASGALSGDGPRPASGSGVQETGRNGRSDYVDPLAKFAKDSDYPALKLEYKTKERERDRLLKTLKPKHPAVVTVVAELEQLQFKLDYALEMIKQQQDALIKSLRNQEATYPAALSALQQQVRQYGQIMHEYDKQKQEESIYQKNLLDLNRALADLEQTIRTTEDQWDVAQAGGGSNVPVGPDRARMILTGLLVGFLVGLGIIYLLHRMDDRLDLAEDIERELEEPVLGQVPQVDTRGLPGGRLLITELAQDDMFAESIRGVRSTILLTMGASTTRTFVVSSALPGDGKTSFTSNFAATLAFTGAKVLLIDADLRRGTTHAIFQMSRSQGLSDILTGRLHWEDVLKHTSLKTLDLITTGDLPPNPGELLVGTVLAEFIEEVKARYDFVIIDTPPLTSINDTFSIVNLADGLVFVVRAGQTSMRFARNALAAVKQREGRILGVVVNGITADNPHYYYNYYYHAYYTAGANHGQARGSESTPATRMAAPRRKGAHVAASMAEEARKLLVQKAGSGGEDAVASESDKLSQYKARRAAGRSPSIQGSQDPVTSPPAQGNEQTKGTLED